MPNRDLKESNRRSPSLQRLSDGAERLWYRLITAVDDFGRLEADPEVVFTTCFQRVPKTWTIAKVRNCLIELATSHDGDDPLISLYTVGGRKYLQILSAKQHIYQRAKQSKYPDQQNQEVTEILPHVRTDERKCAQIPSIPESRTPSPEIPNPDPRTSVAEAATRFHEFWQVYPSRNGKKVEKAKAETLFLKLSDGDQILAVTAARNYAGGLKVDGLSPKDPKRFLRDGVGHEPWRDWIEPVRPVSVSLPKSARLVPTNVAPGEPCPPDAMDKIRRVLPGFGR